jgi:short-subunit dehydrogenase
MRSAVTGTSAVVTGGAHGLGAEIARRLSARGYRVVVADRDADGARATAAALGAAATTLDVADLAACRALAAETPELGVWVNNAGILATGPSWETDEATRRRLFDVNLHGVINGTTAALETFRPAGRGAIINIVSLAGIVPAPHETIYSATKHAALAYSVGTQLDLIVRGERGIRISALCPDGMWTPMLHARARDPDAWPSWSGAMLSPATVADAAVALLDRPRMVRSLPRWRGVQLRLVAAAPGLVAPALPAVAAVARYRQRRFADRHPA